MFNRFDEIYALQLSKKGAILKRKQEVMSAVLWRRRWGEEGRGRSWTPLSSISAIVWRSSDEHHTPHLPHLKMPFWLVRNYLHRYGYPSHKHTTHWHSLHSCMLNWRSFTKGRTSGKIAGPPNSVQSPCICITHPFLLTIYLSFTALLTKNNQTN